MKMVLKVAPKNDVQNSMEHIIDLSKRMLKSSLFVGTFKEKRFVEPLQAYRAVVKVNDDEDKFVENLLFVKRRIETALLEKKWIGITTPDTIGSPVGYNLWVTLSEEILGTFWFKVKAVEFLKQEIRLKLEVVRPFKRERTPTGNVSELDSEPGLDSFNFCQKYGEDFLNSLKDFYTNVLTFENAKASVTFLSFLAVTIITAGVEVIKYLMEYFLKLLAEFTKLVKVSTPMVNSLFHYITMIVLAILRFFGGLFRTKDPVYVTNMTYPPQFNPRLGNYNAMLTQGQYTPNPRAYRRQNAPHGVQISEIHD